MSDKNFTVSTDKAEKNSKVLRRVLVAIIAVVLVFCAAGGGFLIFVADYYHVDEEASAEISRGYTVREVALSDDVILYGAEENAVGLVFYPGAKVEFTAYAPLMRILASKGITCALVKMPFNLAFFNQKAADKVISACKGVESWYVGGHSLGGAVAAIYAEGNSDKLKGLVLLASYSTKDVKHSGLKVLSVYGSLDGVIDSKKYSDNLKNLPDDYVEYVVEGGNHAYFGAYGEQSGDGAATISNAAQVAFTADRIEEWVFA